LRAETNALTGPKGEEPCVMTKSPYDPSKDRDEHRHQRADDDKRSSSEAVAHEESKTHAEKVAERNSEDDPHKRAEHGLHGEHAGAHDSRGGSEAVAHEEKQKPLSGKDKAAVVDGAREAWATQQPVGVVDSLGRSWAFEIVSNPIHGLKLTVDGLSLGLTAAQVEANDPDAVTAAVADLDKAAPGVSAPQASGPKPEPAKTGL
jgi:hypothetical protein